MSIKVGFHIDPDAHTFTAEACSYSTFSTLTVEQGRDEIVFFVSDLKDATVLYKAVKELVLIVAERQLGDSFSELIEVTSDFTD